MTQITHPVPDEALDADIVTLAQKGAGKTYTNRGLVERLLDMNRRVVVMDPLHTWWGLKVKADGSPGYPVVVIGGPDAVAGGEADLLLQPDRGAELGEWVAKNHVSIVFDLSETTRGQMIRFSTAFLAALYRFTREALWLIAEEADVFAPQQPMSDATMLLHTMDEIARRGRARGLRLWSITQRPARLHKDILTQASTLLLMRLRAPQDRAAAEEWIKGHAEKARASEISRSLASLKTGEGYVWSPDHDILERVSFPAIKTLDTGATPKAGEKRVAVKKFAKADFSALEALLAPPPPVGTDKSSKAVPDAPQVDLDAVRAEAHAEGRKIGLQEGTDAGIKIGLSMALDDLRPIIAKLEEQAYPDFDFVTDTPPARRSIDPGFARSLPDATTSPTKATPSPSVPTPSLGAVATKPTTTMNGASLSGSHQRVIDGLAWWASVGEPAPSRIQLGAAARFSPSSGNFKNLLGGLRTMGLVDYPSDGLVSLTPEGHAAASPSGWQGLELISATRSIIKMGGAARMFDAIVGRTRAGQAVMTREEIAEDVGLSVTSGNFKNLLGSIRTIGIIDYPVAGSIKLEPWVVRGL